MTSLVRASFGCDRILGQSTLCATEMDFGGGRVLLNSDFWWARTTSNAKKNSTARNHDKNEGVTLLKRKIICVYNPMAILEMCDIQMQQKKRCGTPMVKTDECVYHNDKKLKRVYENDKRPRVCI